MKKHSLILVLAVLLLAMTALAACNGGNDQPAETTESWLCACGVQATGNFCSECGAAKPTETADETTSDGTDAATEPESENETSDETDGETEPETTAPSTETDEPETLAPRYDYFGADVKADVTIDSAVYADMKLTLPASLQITAQDVADYIESIRFQYREAVNGTTQVTDKAMNWGDDAYIYYKGVVDGEEFEGGSNWDDTTPYTLGLGSGAFIPGFEAGLVGVIPANATKESPAEVHVTFPENYNEKLAGKDAIFYVAVEYAVQYTLPEYNRDFVENTLKYEGKKEFYAGDRAYLDEFEDYIRTYLESQIAEDLEYAKTDALWSYLVEAADCKNLPQLELDYYFNAYLDEIEYYYNYYKTYGGTSFTDAYPTLDDFAKSYVGVDKDGDWRAELNEVSADMVCKDMIIHAIAEIEGMETVTDEEFESEITYWVEYYQGYMTKDEILANMGEEVIREGALTAKMQSWLLERVTFSFDTEAE